MTGFAIPTEPDGFDAAVVEALIATKHPDVRVGSTALVDAALSSDENSRVSTARRITFDVDYIYNPVSLPVRVTIKVARPGLGGIPLYDNEVNVYTYLGDELPVVTPRCLGAWRDVGGGTFGIVLEDLRVSGAEFPTVLTPVGVEDVKVLLSQLAELHAHYWQSTRFGADLSWLWPHTSGPIHELFTDAGAVPALVAWEVRTRQFKRELLQSVSETTDSLLAKVTRAQMHQAALPTTVVHGDCHIGNTYVLPDGGRGLIDWQLTARGFCMHDVSYIIITALSVQDRRTYEDELIAFYRQRLIGAGVRDAPGVKELRCEHSLAAAWCFYIGWLTTPVENYGWEINVANQIRLATAYRDLESKAALEALGQS
ncbi:MAG: phosphotransferase [Actinomycetota bacterium]|nr:phosphotransferase [Actinomycetota bacterium]MDA2948963.1 phosphotransferase [Actinomycetota bacterium]